MLFFFFVAAGVVNEELREHNTFIENQKCLKLESAARTY